MFFFFFFNDTATTEIYTLSLHDALPISNSHHHCQAQPAGGHGIHRPASLRFERSEEHTSELQSQSNLVCRLLLEKKKSSFSHQLHLLPSPRRSHPNKLDTHSDRSKYYRI